MNYDILIGKTIEEANNFLKVRSFFVTDSEEQLHYSNAIKVKVSKGKITEVITNERKNKKIK